MFNCIILKNKQIYWLSQKEVDAINLQLDNGDRFIKLERFGKRINVDSIDSVGIHPCFYLQVNGENIFYPVVSNGIIYAYSPGNNDYWSFTGEKWKRDFEENYKRGTAIANLIPQDDGE